MEKYRTEMTTRMLSDKYYREYVFDRRWGSGVHGTTGILAGAVFSFRSFSALGVSTSVMTASA